MSLFFEMEALVKELKHEAYCLKSYELDRLKKNINDNLDNASSIASQTLEVERIIERISVLSGVVYAIESKLQSCKNNGKDVTDMISELSTRLDEVGEENDYTLFCGEEELKELKDTLDNIFER